MDWFEKLTGFRETDYDDTRGKLRVEGRRLKSLINGKSYGIGELELVIIASPAREGKIRKRPLWKTQGKCGNRRRATHASVSRERPGFVSSGLSIQSPGDDRPEVTPENGVTIYEHDHTQGPACAIAAGAATIYRN